MLMGTVNPIPPATTDEERCPLCSRTLAKSPPDCALAAAGRYRWNPAGHAGHAGALAFAVEPRGVLARFDVEVAADVGNDLAARYDRALDIGVAAEDGHAVAAADMGVALGRAVAIFLGEQCWPQPAQRWLQPLIQFLRTLVLATQALVACLLRRLCTG